MHKLANRCCFVSKTILFPFLSLMKASTRVPIQLEKHKFSWPLGNHHLVVKFWTNSLTYLFRPSFWRHQPYWQERWIIRQFDGPLEQLDDFPFLGALKNVQKLDNQYNTEQNWRPLVPNARKVLEYKLKSTKDRHIPINPNGLFRNQRVPKRTFGEF